jgi:two-component system CitB family sensor kinase
MGLLSRLSLLTRMVLIQAGIIVLVAGLISAAVASVLQNLVEQQAGERALGIARTVAMLPAVRSAFDSPNPAETIQPLAESMREASGVSFIVVSNHNMIRYSHPNPSLVGRSLLDPPPNGTLVEDDTLPLRGETVVAQEDGSLGRSIRAKVPIYATDGT